MSAHAAPQALDATQARSLEQVSRLLQAGRADEALEVSQRLVAEAGMAPDAHHLLALCHAEAGDQDAAAKAFLRALELAPGHPMILVNYAVMLRKAGRFAPAIQLLHQATASAPGFAKAWSELGSTELRAGHPDRAQPAFKQAVQLEPEVARHWQSLGAAARETGDLDVAETALRKAIALQPSDSAASLELGAVLRLAGRPDAAAACFDLVRTRGDTRPEVADALVGALIDDGRFDDAEQLARQVVREHPDFVPGRVTLANLLWEYRPAAALDEDPFDLFRSALQRAPDHHEMRAAFIRLLLSAGAADEGLEQLRWLRARADDPMLAWLQANALAMLGRDDQAGALYSQLRGDWGGQVPAFLNSHARHLLTTGKWDAAADVASRATVLDPGNQEAWANLATAWRLLEDPREDWLCDYDRLVGFIDIESPPAFANQSAFLDALTANLDLRHQARHEPLQQSLRGGSQTPGRLFGRPDPLLASTRAALIHGVERWLATLPADASHPFLQRKSRSVRIGGSWSVKLWSSGSHVNHIHPEGWISSAFYVALPPSMGKATQSDRSGCIQFGQPPAELKLDLPPRRVIRPEPGKLALFPSYLWHGTVPFEDAQPRVTIAFDMTPLADPD